MPSSSPCARANPVMLAILNSTAPKKMAAPCSKVAPPSPEHSEAGEGRCPQLNLLPAWRWLEFGYTPLADGRTRFFVWDCVNRYVALRFGRGAVVVLRDVSAVFGERRGKDMAAPSVGDEVKFVGEGRPCGGAQRGYPGIVDRAGRQPFRHIGVVGRKNRQIGVGQPAIEPFRAP